MRRDIGSKAVPLRPYRQPVLDVLDAGGKLRLDRKFLVPITDLAFKQDFIVVSNGDEYVLGFDFGVPLQGRFDLPSSRCSGFACGSISMLLTTLRTPDSLRTSRSALLF